MTLLQKFEVRLGRLYLASTRQLLVDGAASGDELLGFKGDGAEGLLVLGEVVVEDVGEGLGLLRAEVDSLEVLTLTSSGVSWVMVPKTRKKSQSLMRTWTLLA